MLELRGVGRPVAVLPVRLDGRGQSGHVMIDYSIREQGAALIPGRANMLMRRYVTDVQETVAVYAESQVMMNLQRSLRTRTPYYETRVSVRYRRGAPVVTDGGVIYGPWLEGVSRRNQTTRFKGYASFRRARQATDRRAPEIADRLWATRYAGRF